MATTTAFTIKGAGGVTVSRVNDTTLKVDGAGINGGTCYEVAQMSPAGSTITIDALSKVETGVVVTLYLTSKPNVATLKFKVGSTSYNVSYRGNTSCFRNLSIGVYRFVYTGSEFELITPIWTNV